MNKSLTNSILERSESMEINFILTFTQFEYKFIPNKADTKTLAFEGRTKIKISVIKTF